MVRREILRRPVSRIGVMKQTGQTGTTRQHTSGVKRDRASTLDRKGALVFHFRFRRPFFL